MWLSTGCRKVRRSLMTWTSEADATAGPFQARTARHSVSFLSAKTSLTAFFTIHEALYGRLPGRKDRFGCDGQADCSFVSGLLMRDLVPTGPDGICRSAPHLSYGLLALCLIQAWRIAV